MMFAQDLALTHYLADVSNRLAVTRQASDVKQWVKEDGSALTELDLAIEDAILDILARERPNDGILAEESGASNSASPANGRRWLIDPLDGTRHFLTGGENWGTHIALEEAGRIVVAVITRPTKGIYYWAATGQGAWLRRSNNHVNQRLCFTSQRDLASAKVVGLVDEPSLLVDAVRANTNWIEDEQMAIEALLEGRVDALLDVGGNVWDQAPLTLLVIEAGGFFSDPQGGARNDCGFGLFSSNSTLHSQLWEIVVPYLQKES